MVSHMTRGNLKNGCPLHVTTRLKKGLPRLRQKAEYEVVRAAFAKGCDRFGFRLVQYSVQGNHLHLVCEAVDRRALARGMQGLLVRVARGLNKLWGRKGGVFADHYHDQELGSPRQVRNALAYVLNNARHHRLTLQLALDYYASGPWFGGWKEDVNVHSSWERPVASARTWLLKTGWRRHVLIRLEEVPG